MHSVTKTNAQYSKNCIDCGIEEPACYWLFYDCILLQASYLWSRAKGTPMKKEALSSVPQPQPVTPGITMAMVRQHAYEMFRDKLPDHPLTLEDWVLAEKDLVNSLDADNMPK